MDQHLVEGPQRHGAAYERAALHLVDLTAIGSACPQGRRVEEIPFCRAGRVDWHLR